MGALGIRAAAAKSCPVSPAGRHFTKRSMEAEDTANVNTVTVRHVRTDNMAKMVHRFAAHDDKSADVRAALGRTPLSPDEVRVTLTRRPFSSYIPSLYSVYLKWYHENEQVIVLTEVLHFIRTAAVLCAPPFCEVR